MRKGSQDSKKVGKGRSPETRKRISEGLRRAWADPAKRKGWT